MKIATLYSLPIFLKILWELGTDSFSGNTIESVDLSTADTWASCTSTQTHVSLFTSALVFVGRL
jgi:hypothetical protein